MSKRRPDPVDERILRLLVRNARTSWRDIGAEVGLSANAVAQRVHRLEDDGWVQGFTVRLDRSLDAEHSTALVLLQTATDVDVDAVEAAMVAIPEVAEVLDLTGPVDYQVTVRFSSQRTLYGVVNRLRALPGVTGIQTRTVLREVLRRGH